MSGKVSGHVWAFWSEKD
jgi:hypothetical protein